MLHHHGQCAVNAEAVYPKFFIQNDTLGLPGSSLKSPHTTTGMDQSIHLL